MKKLLSVLLVLAMICAIAACKQPSAAPAAPAPEAAAPAAPETGISEVVAGEDAAVTAEDAAITEKPAGIQAGTVFKYWTNYDVPLYLPWIDNRANALLYQLYDNLIYKYHGDQNDIRGNLAESWTVSEDGLTWVFQIKKNATFWNGNPISADTFIKNWDAAKEFQPRMFAPVESYTATGEYELTIKLVAPSATFIYDLPMQPICGVVDPAALAEFGPEDNRSAIGSGPYMIDSYTSGEGWVLKANPNYHNPDKAPSVETCELVLIPDENTALIALMNGELDCMNTVNIEVVNNLVEHGWNVAAVEDRVNPFWFNASVVPLFQDYTVREALCHMIDWDALNELVYDGKFVAPDSYWVGPGSYPYDDRYAYDPERGIKMLEDAGYSKDDIDFTILADPDFTNLEVAMVAQFNELGFMNIKTETLDGGTCYGMLKGGTYEMFPCHNGYGVESPLTCYSMGLVPSRTQPCMWLDYMNMDAYNEALEYYDKANTAPDFATYLAAVEQITRICQEQCAALGGLQVTRYYGINPKFSGMYVMPIVGYIEFAYLWSNVG